jgi:hypothetical protein
MYNLLELDVCPFGEVPHSAIDAADDGACLPMGLLVHFGGAV